MATVDVTPSAKPEPELNLLLKDEQGLWKSLTQNLNDFFFPKKLPPLVLTSKPVPVKDIWGFYDYKKRIKTRRESRLEIKINYSRIRILF